MRARAHKRSVATRIRRSQAVKRTGAIALSSAILVGRSWRSDTCTCGCHERQTQRDLREGQSSARECDKAQGKSARRPDAGSRQPPIRAFGTPERPREFMPGGKAPAKNPNDPNLINQNPSSVYKQGLNITVAKSVLASTDASGNPKLNVLLANTQVSGTGSATVKVPVGPRRRRTARFAAPTMQGDEIVYNVDNSGKHSADVRRLQRKLHRQAPRESER